MRDLTGRQLAAPLLMVSMLVLGLACASSAWAQSINRDDITYVLPYWFDFLGSSDNAAAAEIDEMRSRLGPEGPYVKLGFAVYLFVKMENWEADPGDPAAVRAGLSQTISLLDRQISKARRLNVPISVSVLTAIRGEYDPVQRASEAEDVRSMQWFANNELAAGWWVHSRYARKARRLQEAYIRELGKVIANRMHLYPDILVAASGDGEVELVRPPGDQPELYGDYSPFTVAEFRDWLRRGGLYASGAAYASDGYEHGGRYAGDATPGDDTNGDGHTLNGDFGTGFTTWDLRHFNWSLDDPWESNDPGAIPLGAFSSSGFAKLPANVPGGFDPPRSPARGQPWWDVWDLFKQTMIHRHNREFAEWATTSVDPDTGATIPPTRWYSYQIPADYLFGGTPEYPHPRWYSSMSSWWTADIAPYGGLGVTGFNVDFGSWQALTIPHVAPHIAARDRRWGIIEWNPGVTYPVTGVSTNEALLQTEMDTIAQYRPTLLQPWVWEDRDYWQRNGETCCGIKDTLFESSLRGLIASIKDGLPPDPRLEIEIPSAGAGVVQPFSLSGWAVDLGKIRGPGRGPGVDDIQVDAQREDDSPVSFDTARYGLARPDRAAEFGDQFLRSGFSSDIDGLPPGRYVFTVRARSTVTNTYSIQRQVTIDVYDQLTTNPRALVFAATKAGPGDVPVSSTPPQTVTVSYPRGGTPVWTATADQPWLQISHASGTGSGEFTVAIVNPGNVIGARTQLSATITVMAQNIGAVATLPVTLTVDQSGGVATAPPFGLVELPVAGTGGVTGTIPVTGWVLDDVGVAGVRVYRACLPSLEACATIEGVEVVFIGDATLVSGIRPDIEAAYPAYPQNQRAAWGYLLLTNLLPHVPDGQLFGGQGRITLYARARDVEGKEAWLLQGVGAEAAAAVPITLDNANVARPFGAIDLPAQGATVGGRVATWGWALTPDANSVGGEAADILVPIDGTTIQVLVDGAAWPGSVLYNLCRGNPATGGVRGVMPPTAYCDDDVASAFGHVTPQPVFTPRTRNPTKHRNLDRGRGAIGAQALDTTTLANGLHTIMWGVRDSQGRADAIGSRYFTVLNTGADARPGIWDRGPGTRSDSVSRRDITGPRSPIPGPRTPAEVFGRTGLSLDAPFVELRPDGEGVRHVRLAPLDRLELKLVAVDAGYLVANGEWRPLPPGSRLDAETGTFTWAPGVGFLGTYRLAFGRARSPNAPDAEALTAPTAGGLEGPSTPSSGAFGERARPYDARDLEWGRGTSLTDPRSPVPGPGEDLVLVDVTIRPVLPPVPGEAVLRMSLDTPQTGTVLRGPFVVAGWALDPAAAMGAGIGAIHVWAQSLDRPGTVPQFLGAATLGGARADVAEVEGPSFSHAGFTLTVDPAALKPGLYALTAYAWNRRTTRWEDARSVTITVR